MFRLHQMIQLLLLLLGRERRLLLESYLLAPRFGLLGTFLHLGHCFLEIKLVFLQHGFSAPCFGISCILERVSGSEAPF